MEHTKGTLRVSGDYIISPQNEEDFIRICKIFSFPDAKELVRRWNAFEKGGVVDELKTAADEGLHECERVKINCTCEHKDLGGLLRRIGRIEAAIAKVS